MKTSNVMGTIEFVSTEIGRYSDTLNMNTAYRIVVAKVTNGIKIIFVHGNVPKSPGGGEL